MAVTEQVRVRRWVLGVILSVTSIACGYLVQFIATSGVGVTFDAGSGGHLEIESAPQNAIFLAILGGFPAVLVSILSVNQGRSMEAARVLRRVWIGPVVTGVLFGLILMVVYPLGIVPVFFVAVLCAIGCGVLFEIAGSIAIGLSWLSRHN